MKQRFIKTLFSFLLTIGLIEGGLRLIDPLGAWEGYANTYSLWMGMHADPALGYVTDPGTISMLHHSITVGRDGTRTVPDTNPAADFSLVFLGDSMTFNAAVRDCDTWPNLVAKALPDAQVIVAGLPGYNSRQIRLLWQSYPEADAFIYLVYKNDPGEQITYMEPSSEHRTALYAYLEYARWFRSWNDGPKLYWPRFYADLDAMAADPRVTFVAFDDEFGQSLAGRYEVHLIPPYQHVVSQVDIHPDEEGNREIAEAMLPIAKRLLNR